jgi:glycosyltransferase involved in cell wall biosynthesis
MVNPAPSESVSVSVIVPCRNEERFIGRCLESIQRSDYPADRWEVIVADGLSDDGTRAEVAAFCALDARVRMIDNPERITPTALNRAIDAARGEVIVRLDAHAEMAPDYISKCVAALQCSGAANAGGVRVERAQEPGLFAGAIVAALTCRFGVGNARYRLGTSGAGWVDTVFGGCWRREVFERIGKFNPRLVRSQDIEFNQRLQRAGGKIWMTPEAVTYYYTRSRLKAYLRHNWVNGIWSLVPFAYSDVIPVRLRHLAPLGFVLSTLLLVASTGIWKWAPALTLTPYALANLGASLYVAASRKSWRLLFLLPVTFACLHFPYGAGSLWGAVRVAAIWLQRLTGGKGSEARIPANA